MRAAAAVIASVHRYVRARTVSSELAGRALRYWAMSVRSLTVCSPRGSEWPGGVLHAWDMSALQLRCACFARWRRGVVRGNGKAEIRRLAHALCRYVRRPALRCLNSRERAHACAMRLRVRAHMLVCVCACSMR